MRIADEIITAEWVNPALQKSRMPEMLGVESFSSSARLAGEGGVMR
jgi:hypothetical protein